MVCLRLLKNIKEDDFMPDYNFLHSIFPYYTLSSCNGIDQIPLDTRTRQAIEALTHGGNYGKA